MNQQMSLVIFSLQDHHFFPFNRLYIMLLLLHPTYTDYSALFIIMLGIIIVYYI